MDSKTENYGVKIDTWAGGKSEPIGADVYTGFGNADKSMLFRIENSLATFAGVREKTFSDNGYHNSVTETRGGERRGLLRGSAWASWTLYSGAKE